MWTGLHSPEAPGKVLLCLVQLLEAAGAPCLQLHHPMSALLQCLYHLSCLHHPSVCITSRVCITPVSVSPLVSASPLCLHHLSCLHRPRVCLHPTWPPHPGISVSPHPRLRVPGTGFRSHPQNGGPHLYLISSAKTVSPEVSLSEVPGGCDLGDYCHYRGYK